MVFVSLCTAVYDYTPQSDSELAIKEGELIYILEKSADDDWWKAKKRAPGEAEEEPVGLIPNNYVEQAKATHHAKALYDYTRQTDEELSFSEDSALLVYDTTDPDWTLVGLNGEFGFAPANYIELSGEADQMSPAATLSPQLPPRETEMQSPSTGFNAPSSGAAAALAGIIHQQTSRSRSGTAPSATSPPSNITLPPRRPQYTPEASDEELPTPPAPSLPQRPLSGGISSPVTQYASTRNLEPPSVTASPPYNRAMRNYEDDQNSPSMRSPSGGYHLYNINEMVSALGKKKKMPTTLGLNIATGNIMIAPEKSRDGPQQEWTGEKLTHYSIEGKHVFMELVRPSKSIDFHAGAKDTAQEIVSGLGEIAGAARAEGLREVLAAGSGSGGLKRGHVLYDFMAQGDDEVTVAVGDEVIIIDDTKSDEWWMIRRLKNGNEGVVPSSYIEQTGMTTPLPDNPGLKAARSVVEQNRLEEERLAKQAAKSSKSRGGDARGSEVGPGVKLPKRGSSLAGSNDSNQASSQRSKKESKSHGRSGSSSKSKPDVSKTRTWTDRSGTFKVEAQFIGLKDGKIHLHKLNGVKIAVSVAKMAIEDLEYVERVTGISLDDDKPLSDIRRRSLQAAKDERKKSQASAAVVKPGLSDTRKPESKPEPKGPEYDWFDFFLKAGVNIHQCERYAINFSRDSMDESILPDITPTVLRTLGLKEGDILRVTKYLDSQYARTGAKSKARNISFGDEATKEEEGSGTTSPDGTGGGLFSGPGGALRNNTRKGRPAPAVQNDVVVDAKTFKQIGIMEKKDQAEPTPLASVSSPEKRRTSGFDDDAWDVKPSRQAPSGAQITSTAAPASTTTTAPQPPLTGAFAELSLLSPPLQPIVMHNNGPQQFQPSKQEPQPAQQQTQPTGANQSFFSQLPQSTAPQLQQQVDNQAPSSNFNTQPAFQGQQPPQQNQPPRQRPQPPQANPQGSLLPPPPPRPLSAPQNVSQNNSFGPPPLQPQLTGAPNQNNLQNLMAPSGPSLNDLDRLRAQQQQQYVPQQVYPQQTGFAPQNQGFSQFGNGIPVQQSYGQQYSMPPNFQTQSFLTGQQTRGPFVDPRFQQQQMGNYQQPLAPQATGYSLQSQPQPSVQPNSINSVLPPLLQPQITAAPNGFGTRPTNGYSGVNRPAFGQPPPMPSSSPFQPQLQQAQPTLQPLQPQKTGPAPSIRFGVGADAKKLMPQPTGRRANLSHATPQNPFGFD